MNGIVNRLLGAALVALFLSGCAMAPSTTGELTYRSRAVTRTEGGLRVSAVVLSAEESAAVYGVPLAKKGIQPVWIEVSNDETLSYFLMSPGLDPNFFPASEAAEAFINSDSSARKDELDRRFRELAFQNPIVPGQTESGFVLTNLTEGAKLVQLDLVASERARTFSILMVVPGFRADYQVSEVFRRDIYPADAIVNYTDDDAFRVALEALPCCATNKDGSKNGDPLNLVIVGGLDDAFPALVRRGWSPTEQKSSGAIMRMVTSALSGDRYVNAPVSDLYLFGRAQDLALQKARDNVHQRNHLRLWLSPDALPGQARVGGPDQPGYRHAFNVSFTDVHHAQDRPGRRRGPHGACRRHGLFAEPHENRAGKGSRRRHAKRTERESHHRSVLHRRVSPGTSYSTAIPPRCQRSNSFRGR